MAEGRVDYIEDRGVCLLVVQGANCQGLAMLLHQTRVLVLTSEAQPGEF